MGWEVEIDMSGHSSHHLRVCNVKMKKFSPGRKRATFWWIFGLWGPSVNRFEFFRRGTPGLAWSSCCEHILTKIN